MFDCFKQDIDLIQVYFDEEYHKYFLQFSTHKGTTTYRIMLDEKDHTLLTFTNLFLHSNLKGNNNG